jgi:GTP cyclohydrolase II
VNDHSLFDDDATAVAQIEAERAIFEVRAGRPVLIAHGKERLFAIGVEALAPRNAAAIEKEARGAAGLCLTGPRLRRLGRDARRNGGVIAFPRIDPLRALALAASPDAKLNTPVAPLSPAQFGALELLRLAQLLPAAVVFSAREPTAACRPFLVSLKHLRAYDEARTASLRIVSRACVPLEGAADCEFVVFRGGEGLRDQVAIVVGRPDFAQPVLVRLHSACLTGDLFGSLKCDCGDQLRGAVRRMAESGGGVLLYLDQEGRGNGLANKIRAYDLQARGFDTYDADETLGFGADQRRFDFAAAMLRQLGATRLRVMTNNPRKIAAIEAAGLTLVSDQRIFGRRTDHNIRYLASKRDRTGHLLEQD